MSSRHASMRGSLYDRLEAASASDGPAAAMALLAEDLVAARRWHAVFDVRLLQARIALGLPVTGDLGRLDAKVREELDERSLAACLEAGWPLLAEGQPAAAWMYLRAAAEPAEVAARLAELSCRDDLPDPATTRGEIMQLALVEGIDPALGIRLVIEDHGTCSAITAYMQSAARLPAARRRPAADRLVDHLHAECIGRQGHADVSHLHNVLEIARECTDRERIERALALAKYAGSVPDDLLMPGDPPFEELAVASRLFFSAQLGRDQEEAIGYFSRKAAEAPNEAMPAEWLAVLLWRTGRAAAALHAVMGRPAGLANATTGLLPSIVEMAMASGEWTAVLERCRERDDPVTFAAALAAHHHLHHPR